MNNLLPIKDPESLRRKWRRRAFVRKSKKSAFSFLRKLGINDLPRLLLGIVIGLIFFFSFMTAILSIGLPNPSQLSAQKQLESTKVLDRNGVVLFDIFGDKRREQVTLANIPEHVEQATISAEDKDFYRHKGFDIKGLIRGVILKPLAGQRAQGGSTITQQLVKNSFLTPKRSIDRKIRELILAIEVERIYTKDKILELYLNEIPYGGRIYGIEEAAKVYFGISAKDLSVAQGAVLAALPQSPTYYSPYGQHPDELMARKDWVLKRMFEEGYITDIERQEAVAEKIEFTPRKDSIRAPHFVMYVKEILADRYGEKMLEEGGLTITTTLDWELQQKAEQVISDRAELNMEKYNAGNAALVTIDPNTGEILAMVGSKDYFDIESDGNVNVTIRDRQPGSAIKPIVYAAAFKKNYGPATMLLDTKTDFGTNYSPNNYNGKFSGPISIRSALQGSVNVPAVKTLAYAGVNATIDLAHKMGITTLNDPERYGLSLVLGGGEVKLLDITSAYGVFATGGKKAQSLAVLKVEDAKGRILEENSIKPLKQVMDPEVAYLINNILSDDTARAPFFGGGGYLTLPGRTVAAKTGTTDLYKDGWTIGYTPNLVTGVWVGNNMNEPMKNGAGLSVAAPIWQAYMKSILTGTPNKNFNIPSGIRTVVVDKLSGKLPSDATPATKTEVFSSWGVPTEKDTVHKKVNVVNFAPDRLPPKDFPENLIEEKIFIELHSERPNIPDWENPVIEWAIENGYNNIPNQIYDGPASGQSGPLEIITPTNGLVVNKNFVITAKVEISEEVEELIFYYDGNRVKKLQSAPWRVPINDVNLDGKSHSVRVVMKRKSGSSLDRTVYIIAGGATEQNMITLRDVNNSLYPVSLIADLTDSGKQLEIDKIEMYLDNVKRETFLPNSTGTYTTVISSGIKGQHAAWVIVFDKDNQQYMSNKINFSTI